MGRKNPRGTYERLYHKIDKKRICRYLKEEYDNIDDPNSIFTDQSFVDEYTGCNLTSSIEKDIKHGFILLTRLLQAQKYEVYDVDEIVEEIIAEEIEDEIISEIIYIENEVAIYLVSKEEGKYGSNRSIETKIYFGFNLLFYIPNNEFCFKKDLSKYRNIIGNRYVNWIKDIKESDSGSIIIKGEDLVDDLGLEKIDEKTYAGLKKILIDKGINIVRNHRKNRREPIVVYMSLIGENKEIKK